MTFSCKNHDFETDICKKLKSRCIMGRPGCVLEGKVSVSEETLKMLLELEENKKSRQGNCRNRKKDQEG
ncbi:MAG: hypothetical protein KKG47_02920 [Proteobacteria bacterium]|nr:hypothetical protein [Pseudomonadota bacterium]MBU1737937.1 hypothetical protein [Pseudomonadota bacterium]